MIFDMYAYGKSYNNIMEKVEQTGIRGKFGQRITKNTLHYILKNERYAGVFIWNEYTMRHMHQWVGQKNEEYIRIEGAIPAIVSRPTFDAVARRMAGNKRFTMNRATKEGRHYLLTGVMTCSLCGGPMHGTTVISRVKNISGMFAETVTAQRPAPSKILTGSCWKILLSDF